MLRFATTAADFGSFIGLPATLCEPAAWPDGLEDEAGCEDDESLEGCVEQPTAKAARTANGMTRTACFMGLLPLVLCGRLYLYKCICGSRRYYFRVERPTHPCRARPHAGGPCPVPGGLQVDPPPL